MDKIISNFRYLSWVAIICSLAGSFLMFVIGALKTYSAFVAVFFSEVSTVNLAHLEEGDIATTYLIKSLDAFLIAFVLFIFSYGIYSLFISSKHRPGDSSVLGWINIPSISHLKNVLAEVIIIILFVKFLETVLVSIEQFEWEILTLPLSILLLALSLKFLDLGRKVRRAVEKDEQNTLGKDISP